MNLNLTQTIIVAALITILVMLIAAVTTAIIKAYAEMNLSGHKQNEVTFIDAQKGRKRTKIKQLRGTGSASKMKTCIENENDFPMEVISQAGTVFHTPNSKLQEMVTVRSQVFEVLPKSSEDFTVDALCIEPFKAPPPLTGEGAYKAIGLTRNGKILNMLRALGILEQQISEKIVAFIIGSGFTVKPMNEETEEWLNNCELLPNKSGGYDAKIKDKIVLFALWQVTNELNFDTLARITGSVSEESQDELRRFIKLANSILRRAGIRPTA